MTTGFGHGPFQFAYTNLRKQQYEALARLLGTTAATALLSSTIQDYDADDGHDNNVNNNNINLFYGALERNMLSAVQLEHEQQQAKNTNAATNSSDGGEQLPILTVQRSNLLQQTVSKLVFLQAIEREKWIREFNRDKYSSNAPGMSEQQANDNEQADDENNSNKVILNTTSEQAKQQRMSKYMQQSAIPIVNNKLVHMETLNNNAVNNNMNMAMSSNGANGAVVDSMIKPPLYSQHVLQSLVNMKQFVDEASKSNNFKVANQRKEQV